MRQTLVPALLLASLIPGLCLAHANLTSPAPRNLLANKVGPCGIARGATVNRFQPGETITVKWVETYYHEGFFRLSFSSAEDKDFTLLKEVPHDPKTRAPINYETTVTLPDTPCTNCTLQLIQVMIDRGVPSNYYSCANLNLVAAPPADGGAGPIVPDAGSPDVPPPATSTDAGTVVDGGAAEVPSPGEEQLPDELPRGTNEAPGAEPEDDRGEAPTALSSASGSCGASATGTVLGGGTWVALATLRLLRRRRR